MRSGVPACSHRYLHHEIATKLEEVTHTTVFVKFPLLHRPCESLLLGLRRRGRSRQRASAVHPTDLVKVKRGRDVLTFLRARCERGKSALSVGELPGAAI